MTWDLIVRNAKVFDGSGGPGRVTDVAVREGRIAAMGLDLPVAAAASSCNGDGHWLLPGLLDIHTHEDLEAELDPGLPEVVRHGTTSVVVGNCSIGLAFGAQRTPEQDPIVDCFARVENIPKPILARAAEKATWDNPRAYLEHLDALPLAANVAPFVPHSMLRIEVMGLADSVSRDPTKAELARMVGILEEAMQDGYVGMSTDGLPLHFLANQPHIKKRIPTQYAQYAEYKALTDVLRKHDRVWQMTPATDDARSHRQVVHAVQWPYSRQTAESHGTGSVGLRQQPSNQSPGAPVCQLVKLSLAGWAVPHAVPGGPISYLF